MEEIIRKIEPPIPLERGRQSADSNVYKNMRFYRRGIVSPLAEESKGSV